MDATVDTAAVTDEVFAKAVYAAVDKQGGGKQDIPSATFAIAVGANRITLILHRADLPAKTERCCACRIDLSLDGGVTWSPKPSGEKAWPWGHFPIAFVVASGASVNPVTGEPVFESSMFAPLPAPQNPNRMYRVVMTPLTAVNTKVEVLCETVK